VAFGALSRSGALAEQAGPIIVGRSSETQITFTSDGAPASLFYGMIGGTELGTLTIGTDSISLSASDTPGVPAGAIFVCR
jgi:hypothetical protein